MAKPPAPDLSEFDALEQRAYPEGCKMARLVAQLPERDQVNLAAALEQGRSGSLIQRWFRSKGMSLADSTIAKHREGDCVCARHQ